MTKHKWAKEIAAFVNGEVVEYRYATGYGQFEWERMQTGILVAFDSQHLEFRIYKKPQIGKFRVAIFSNAFGPEPVAFDEREDTALVERKICFLRWATDWIEYDKEQS